MKNSKKILELIAIYENDKEVCFGIDTDVSLTEEECNEIIKIYSRAFARKHGIEKEKIEKIENMKPYEFIEIKHDN